MSAEPVAIHKESARIPSSAASGKTKPSPTPPGSVPAHPSPPLPDLAVAVSTYQTTNNQGKYCTARKFSKMIWFWYFVALFTH